MYKLKEKYKDAYISKQGSSFRLANIRQDQIKELGLERYFSKGKPTKKTKSK
tara:strand:- start:337 stop:492 length:156 start_codon:yes stop_codon:yes gene_type:complete